MVNLSLPTSINDHLCLIQSTFFVALYSFQIVYMGNKSTNDDTKAVLENIITAMQEKKAKQIVSMDLNKIPDSVTHYFVICHGTSNTQVDAIYDSVIDEVGKNCGIKPFHKEGYENSEWILIDYFDIVVHIFRENIREFYKLEELWADAEIKEYESME